MRIMPARIAAPLLLLTIAGCASTGQTSLLFGQANTLGISVGASAADQGGDLVLGYKGHNFAIVPVSVGQPDGSTAQVGAAVGNGFGDAYSVLGQFEAKSKTGATTQSAGLGTFFATGLAAKRLSDGFAQKMGDGRTTTSADCGGQQANNQGSATNMAAAADAATTPSTSNPPQSTAQSPQESSGARPSAVFGAETKERKPNLSLVYAQYQSVGFIATAAATQQGADLTLGYKDRNIAIVPTIKRDGAGVASPIESKATASGGRSDFDSLSVLGQFEFDAKNDAGTIDAGLGKFFSTGMAAKRLSDGFATQLCEQNQVAQKPAANP